MEGEESEEEGEKDRNNKKKKEMEYDGNTDIDDGTKGRKITTKKEKIKQEKKEYDSNNKIK